MPYICEVMPIARRTLPAVGSAVERCRKLSTQREKKRMAEPPDRRMIIPRKYRGVAAAAALMWWILLPAIAAAATYLISPSAATVALGALLGFCVATLGSIGIIIYMHRLGSRRNGDDSLIRKDSQPGG